MTLLFIHGENLMFFIVALYLLAILGWTAICCLLIRVWQNRKKKQQRKRLEHDTSEVNEINSHE